MGGRDFPFLCTHLYKLDFFHKIWKKNIYYEWSPLHSTGEKISHPEFAEMQMLKSSFFFLDKVFYTPTNFTISQPVVKGTGYYCVIK